MTDTLDLADLAGRAFGWIASVAVDFDGGLAWLEDGTVADLLYSGTAGVLLGCAEATAAGIDTGQIPAGALGRLRYLAGHGPGAATMEDDGLFTGWAGAAVALRAWSAATGDADAAGTAARITTQVAGRVLAAADGPPGYTDIISGDAGVLLALIADDSGIAAQAAHVLAGRSPGLGAPAGSAMAVIAAPWR